MRGRISWGGITVLPTLLLSGCGVGYNYAFFMSKSNIGIEADSKPPTAEVSIARREVVIEPTFEGGKMFPIISSFKARNDVVSSFFFGVAAMSAGGKAASKLSACLPEEPPKKEETAKQPTTGEPLQGEAPGKPPEKVKKSSQQSDDTQCGKYTTGEEFFLTVQPRGETLGDVVREWQDGAEIPAAGKIKPFFFATDTTFGLKVAWSGTTGQFPDSLKLGFNRKEFALAPIVGRESKNGEPKGFYIKMPSFIAGIDQTTWAGWKPWNWQIGYTQFFATGEAAENLAGYGTITKQMGDMLSPQKIEPPNEKAEDKK